MRKKAILFLIFVLLCLAAGSAIWAAPAGPSGGLSIPWWTVDGGGNTSFGGDFALSGTLGQPDPGEMSGGNYVLNGGFWNSATGAIGGGTGHKLYLPSITR
jgi:hypothetical protein